MKILIIGLGSIAKKHIAALKEFNLNLEIFALRSSSTSEKIEGVTDIYDFGDIKGEYDFAIISNPTSEHKNTLKKLIPLGIPLFIEKPLFDNLQDDGILENIKQKGITTYVACNLRYLDCLNFTKKFISDKRVNEVTIYCGSYLPEWRPGKNFREIYSANKEMGGGVHIDLIHEFDYAYWMFGKPETVSCTTTNSSSLAISAIDYANYNLLYKTFNINITLNYFRKDSKRFIEIVCDNGTLYTDLLTNSVSWNNEQIFLSDQKPTDTYKSQLDFFIRNIITKKSIENNIHEAYDVLHLCLQEN